MAIFYSDVAQLTDNSTPAKFAPGASWGGRLRVYRAVINLATVNGGSAVTTSDAILLGSLPAGSQFVAGLLTISATLGSSAVAIGTSATHGSNGQYRASATYTTTDTPQLFGVTAAKDDAAGVTANTPVYLTCTSANLPTSGTVVVDLIVSQV